MKWLMVGSVGLFGLLMGSFITVLVYRLPLILHAQQHKEQWIINSGLITKPFNLLLPPSHCPFCKHALCFLEKLPLWSYFFLKGRCAYCRKKIHPRYFSIEILACISSSLVAYRFNGNIQMFAALILTWGLIALSGIDFECGLLPDVLVLPLLWLGLIANVFHLFTTPESAILGASLAYFSLWLLAKNYCYFTKKEGMGYGDFKCFALLGAWFGWYVLFYILLISALLGLLVACVLLLNKKMHLHTSLPFGPFLAITGWCTLLLGTKEHMLFDNFLLLI